MLFRVVRPMKREGSRIPVFVQRIPADLRSKAVGRRLEIPLGDSTVSVTVTERAQSIRFSLRTADPSEAKARQAIAAAYIEGVWKALRTDASVSLSHRQATALAGELYRSWADGQRGRTISLEHIDGKWQHVAETAEDGAVYWDAVEAMWDRIGTGAEPANLEKHLGPIVDRVLLGSLASSVPRAFRTKRRSRF